MTQSLVRSSEWFRDRDFFMHDGRQLRRFRLSAPVQAFFFLIAAMLVGWSGYSAARLDHCAPLLAAPAVTAA